MQEAKKNIREPFSLRAIRWSYPKLEKLTPKIAHNIAWNLFFSPFRFNRPSRENEAFETAKQSSIKINHKNIVLFEWGKAENPVAVVVHGWSGRATQFHKFIQPLLNQGYNVVGFDAPAHGLSEGKSTNIKEFYEVLHHIQNNIGEIKIGIGHSFGGVSLLYSIKEGLNLDTVIMISSPTIGADILSSFRKKINASIHTDTALRKMVIQKFDLDFEEITACELIKVITVKNHFIIHDKDDKEVPYSNALSLQQENTQINLLLTNNLGHTRILRDDEVVNATINYILNSKNQG